MFPSNKYNYIVVLLGLLFSCQPKQNETLFTLLESYKTGISFQNDNLESETENIFRFEYFYNGGGVAVGDINNDGLVDIYFSSNQGTNRLFINNGNLNFEDITDKAGVACKAGWKTGVSMADINSDGLIDIYVCRSKDDKPQNRENVLFINNGDLTFTDQAKEFGLNDDSYSTQATFFDYDRDGDLDAFLLNHSLLQISNSYRIQKSKNITTKEVNYVSNKLLRNDEGKFTNVSLNMGINPSSSNFGLGIGLSDINNDGWIDLYTSCDYTGSDKLYLNKNGKFFLDATDSLLSHTSMFSMGLDISDINNDGNMDILSLDMLPPDNARQKQLFVPDRYEPFQFMVDAGLHYQYMRNMLHLNNGDGTFSEVGQLSGLSATDWSWAPLFADYNNDGFQDVFITNSFKRDFINNDFLKYRADHQMKMKLTKSTSFYISLIEKMPSHTFHNYAFQNDGQLKFTEQSKAWGLDEINTTNGSSYADLDNDGDLDLIVNNLNAPAKVYRNNQEKQKDNHYLKVKLKALGKNHFGIGSKVFLYMKGKKQIREMFPTRGFLSSTDPTIHFGLESELLIDSILVRWPTGQWQKLIDVKPDQQIEVQETDNTTSHITQVVNKKLFTAEHSTITYVHHENGFIDFKTQALLPRSYSTEGPALASADVNNDGRADLFVGGAKGQPGELWIQEKELRYKKLIIPDFIKDSESEDVDASFFDADNDGDLDLYVVSGGYEFELYDKNLQDRLYMNHKGFFKRNNKALPESLVSGSCVKPADVDHDGDIDLFIGSRLVPGRYPESDKSILLLNDGHAHFTDQTENSFQKHRLLDLITDALWIDLNNDGFPELITVGEWSPVRVFDNNKGILIEKTNTYFKSSLKGWWNCIAAADLDHDNDIDLVVGNFGLNNQMKATSTEPVSIYYTDFDYNDSVDPILTYFIQGIQYAYADRDELVEQLPFMKKRFTSYEAYSLTTFDKMFSPAEKRKANLLQANTFETMVLLNDGNQSFTERKLPIEAQFAPVYSITIADINQDGHPDIITGGNLSKTRVRTGKLTGNVGFVFLGDGKANFSRVPSAQCGLSFAHKDVRRMLIIGGHIFAAINNGEIQIHKINSTSTDQLN